MYLKTFIFYDKRFEKLSPFKIEIINNLKSKFGFIKIWKVKN
jgi:hypothetical protein